MPMTDAPNFGTKFGRRKPRLRYIGPLLGTTSVAPVGRGDHTPPQAPPLPPVGGGLRPAPLGKASVLRQFPLVRNTSPPRVGADLCVRPLADSARNRVRADTSVGPYGFSCNLHPPGTTGGDGAPSLPIRLQPPSTPEKQDTFPQNPQTNSPFSIFNCQLFIPHSQSSSIRGLSWKRSR